MSLFLPSDNLHHSPLGHWSESIYALKDQEIGEKDFKSVSCAFWMAHLGGTHSRGVKTSVYRCSNYIYSTIHEFYLPPSSWLLVRKNPTALEIGSIRNRKDNESPKHPQGFGIDFLILPLTQNPIWWFSLGWI